jgi:hypothetical protein
MEHKQVVDPVDREVVFDAVPEGRVDWGHQGLLHFQGAAVQQVLAVLRANPVQAVPHPEEDPEDDHQVHSRSRGRELSRTGAHELGSDQLHLLLQRGAARQGAAAGRLRDEGVRPVSHRHRHRHHQPPRRRNQPGGGRQAQQLPEEEAGRGTEQEHRQ